jgi:hypothetical protein
MANYDNELAALQAQYATDIAAGNVKAEDLVKLAKENVSTGRDIESVSKKGLEEAETIRQRDTTLRDKM